MKKGIMIPIGGIIIIVITMLSLYLLKTQAWESNVYVTYKGEIAMSSVHDAELARKMLDEGLYYIGQRAAYDLGNDGGGIEDWASRPTINQAQEKLEEQLNANLIAEGKETPTSYPRRDILWSDRNLTIDLSVPECGSGINSKCFIITGTRDFGIKDERADLVVRSQVEPNKRVNSSYFALVEIARIIIDENQYIGSDDNEIKTFLETEYGLDFFVETSANKVQIIITDDSCVGSGETYCLVPKALEESGDVSKFNFLNLDFDIKLWVIL